MSNNFISELGTYVSQIKANLHEALHVLGSLESEEASKAERSDEDEDSGQQDSAIQSCRNHIRSNMWNVMSILDQQPVLDEYAGLIIAR